MQRLKDWLLWGIFSSKRGRDMNTATQGESSGSRGHLILWWYILYFFDWLLMYDLWGHWIFSYGLCGLEYLVYLLLFWPVCIWIFFLTYGLVWLILWWGWSLNLLDISGSFLGFLEISIFMLRPLLVFWTCGFLFCLAYYIYLEKHEDLSNAYLFILMYDCSATVVC